MDSYERFKKDSSNPASPSVAVVANQPAPPLPVPVPAPFGLNAVAEEPAENNDHYEHENASNDDEAPTHPLAHVKPLQHIRLQCLAARAINRHRVKYGPIDLPQCLIAVVKSHGD